MIKKRPLIYATSLLGSITLIHFIQQESGIGVHELYMRLYYIPILYGAYKMGIKGGSLMSVLAIFAYIPHLALIGITEDVILLNQSLEMILMFFIGTASGYFIERQYKNQQLLENQLKKIQEIEQSLSSVFKSVPQAMFVLDTNYNVTQMNRVAEDILDMLGFGSNITNELIEMMFKNERVFQQLIEGDITNWGDTRAFVFPSGVRTFVVSATTILKSFETDAGVLIILRDITEIVELENQLLLSQRLSALGKLASSIAHEIRNPLGIVKVVLQQMTGDMDVNDFEEGKAIAIDEIDRANRVIQEILEYAKPTKYHYTLVDMEAYVEYIKTLVDNIAVDKIVRIEVVSGYLTDVKIDQDKLTQAIMNLVSNGIEASEDNGTVKIYVDCSNAYLTVNIEDHGHGLSADEQMKIFDPFYTTKRSGTGLGLAITHKIIKDHNGTITCDSQVNQGSLFRIRIPIGV